MSDLSPPKDVARIIKPHRESNEFLKIIICDQTDVCVYEDLFGIRFDPIGVVQYLKDSWPQTKDKRRVKVLFVCADPHKLLIELESKFHSDPEWNARISISEGESEDDEGCTFYRKERIRVSYFGFRDKARHVKYFYPITPLEFMDSLSTYGKSTDTELIKLYRFGCNLRKFCQDNRIRISASRGGISAQLLRDRKFYPGARRKVPMLTNEAARPALPGNCYQAVRNNLGELFQKVYIIDQQNAHHYAAETVPLPHADGLFAYGWYFNHSDDEWINYRDPLFEEVLNEYGLFRARVSIPSRLAGYLPSWAKPNGENFGGSFLTDIWLFSNEIAFAHSLGLQIRHISRWYSSEILDVGLRKYAKWSQDIVRKNPVEKPWIKPALLSAYGILGARPRYIESGYLRSDSGDPHTYILRGHPLSYRQIKTNRKVQSPVASVIQRGMIEAETRKLSIELARRLETEGHNVIGIHADAVLVEDTGQQLPLLPAPWRVKDNVTRFRLLDPSSFVSDELEILPGRPRNAKRQIPRVSR